MTLAIDIDAPEHTLENPQPLEKSQTDLMIQWLLSLLSPPNTKSLLMRSAYRIFGQSFLLRIKRMIIHPALNFFF